MDSLDATSAKSCQGIEQMAPMLLTVGLKRKGYDEQIKNQSEHKQIFAIL
jgi:hypothetical protein